MAFDPFVFVIGSTIAVVIIVIALRFVSSNATRRWNRHKAETVGKWAAEGVEFVRGPKGCQFGGLESMGIHRMVRGIGFVALTAGDLRVTRSTPPGVWIINYRQIKKVTIQPAFMGRRSQKTPFVVVRFSQDGQPDKLAFQVDDYRAWAEALAQAARVRLEG